MRSRTVLGSLIAWCYIFAAPAFAQQEMKIRGEGVRPYTAEVKPMTTALSAVPGIGGVGVGVEAFIAPKVAAVVEGNYLDVDLPGSMQNAARDSGSSQPFPVNTYGYSAGLGARWYASPAQSSWYGGLGVAYAETSGKWEFNNQRVDVTAMSTLPSLAAGYRFLTKRNMLIRLGGGVAANVSQSTSISAEGSSEDASEAQDEVADDFDNDLIANVDLGIGYAW